MVFCSKNKDKSWNQLCSNFQKSSKEAPGAPGGVGKFQGGGSEQVQEATKWLFPMWQLTVTSTLIHLNEKDSKHMS